MIYIALLDTAGVSEKELCKQALPQKEKERINLLKNENVRKEKFTSKLLLKAFYEEKFGAEMPELLHTDKGKPYFCGTPVSVSLSNTDALSVAVLSDSENVGIDAEIISEAEDKLQKVAKRFLSEAFVSELEECFSYSKKGKDDKLDYEINLYRIKEGRIEKCPDTSGIMLLSLDAPNDFNPVFVLREIADNRREEIARAWCVLEASLKASGTGFSGYRRENLSELISDKALLSFYVSVGERIYALALAKQK